VARREGAIAGDPRPADRHSLRLDSSLLVQWEYASEERLAQRNAAYRRLIEGTNAEDVAFEAVAEVRPARVLEVGCGTGEFAERVATELGARVVAIDLSRRMVELTAARGIDARVADVQALPFGDGDFDCVVANWVLYHVPDLERALLELARVLRPGGRLVAATLGVGNLRDLWELLGDPTPRDLSFGSDNGAARLALHFTGVECRDAGGTVVFPDPETMRAFVAATITRAHLAERVPQFEVPFRARCEHVVFVAHKPS
jgi:SAM-dependent methyltransferase